MHCISTRARQRSNEDCAVFGTKAVKANTHSSWLPCHPSLGAWAKWMELKDFMGAAVFLLLISETYLACVTGNDSHRWWGYWSQTWSHRSSEILALHALPKEEEQCLGPYDTHTKPASVCKWVIWAWSVILECVFLLGTLLKCSQCAPH